MKHGFEKAGWHPSKPGPWGERWRQKVRDQRPSLIEQHPCGCVKCPEGFKPRGPIIAALRRRWPLTFWGDQGFVENQGNLRLFSS